MATHQHSVFTETLITEAENRYPHPTLHLTSALSEARNTVFELECEESKQKIVDEIKQALDNDIEKTRALLKAMKPSREGKTDAEFALAVEQFKKSLQIIKGLLEEQSQFNGYIIAQVGNYLVESWRMIQRGAESHECRKFRNDTKKKISNEFQKRSSEIQKRIAKEMNVAKGLSQVYQTNTKLFSNESSKKTNPTGHGHDQRYQQGGYEQGGHGQRGHGHIGQSASGQGSLGLGGNGQGGYGNGGHGQAGRANLN